MTTARQLFVIVLCGLIGTAMGVILVIALAFAYPQTTLETISPPVGVAQTLAGPATDPATGRHGTNVRYIFEDGSTTPTFFFADPEKVLTLASGDLGVAAAIGGALGLAAGLATVILARRRAASRQVGAAIPV